MGAVTECTFEVVEAEAGAPRPKPRYEHGSLCVGTKAFVIGGRSGGRYLNDCWCYDLKHGAWAQKAWREVDQSNNTILPPLAAASYLHLSGFKCVVVGGHTKPDDRTEDIKVYKVDLEVSRRSIALCTPFFPLCPSPRREEPTKNARKVAKWCGENGTNN